MALYELQIPLEGYNIVQGDTIEAINLQFSADSDISLTGATTRFQLYRNYEKIFDVSNGNGMTIVNDKLLVIDEVAKENNTFPSGKFIGDIEVIEADGKGTTLMRVKYTVQKQFSK